MVKTLNIYIISPLNAKNQSLIEKKQKERSQIQKDSTRKIESL